MTYTMTVGDTIGSHTVAVGNKYSFYYVAVNALGPSEDSELLQVVIDNKPNTPNDPTFDNDASSSSQITIDWAAGSSPNSDVTGYRLYSDLGLFGDYYLIWDGDGFTNKLSYTHENLQEGFFYSYYVEVLNFNGASDPSNVVSRYACSPPSNFLSAYIKSVSTSTV